MGDIDLSQFRALYNQTALEYLKKLEDDLKTLSNNSQDKKSLEEMHIAAHSLKSQSLIMGYTTLAEAAFSLEKTFRHFIESGIALSQELIHSIATLTTAMRQSLTQIVEGKPELDIKTQVAEFKRIGGIE